MDRIIWKIHGLPHNSVFSKELLLASPNTSLSFLLDIKTLFLALF